MGKNIEELANEIGYDGVRGYLEDKTNDYLKIMGYYCSIEEVNNKRKNIVGMIRKLNNDYFSKKNFDDKYNTHTEMTEELSRVYNDEKRKFNQTKYALDYLINDEEFFLDYFTSNGTDKTGVIYQDENNQVLYKGINKSICQSILSIMDLSRKKEGKAFYYDVADDDKPIIQSVAKDEVVYALSNERFIGGDLYKFFFNGDGASFDEAIHNLMPNNMVELFNRAVDESVFEDKNDLYREFNNICKMVMNSDYSLKNSKTY